MGQFCLGPERALQRRGRPSQHHPFWRAMFGGEDFACVLSVCVRHSLAKQIDSAISRGVHTPAMNAFDRWIARAA
jgi:hypothetical protein